jgi:phosphoribosylformylglycinamidine synthase PurS subunit
VRARVLVKPKAGILDPQGQAVERALPALGFTGVRNVHIGRLIELDVEDPGRLPEMCQRLLTNPLIEDYEIVASAEADPIGGSPGRRSSGARAGEADSTEADGSGSGRAGSPSP